jgi:hypothetical protein
MATDPAALKNMAIAHLVADLKIDIFNGLFVIKKRNQDTNFARNSLLTLRWGILPNIQQLFSAISSGIVEPRTKMT